MNSSPDLKLTQQQLAFFDTFGYLGFPGLLADRVNEIITAFERVFASKGGGHYGKPHDGELMVRTANPQRMRHLEQVMANDSHLAALTAKAGQTMAEPSRY